MVKLLMLSIMMDARGGANMIMPIVIFISESVWPIHQKNTLKVKKLANVITDTMLRHQELHDSQASDVKLYSS